MIAAVTPKPIPNTATIIIAVWKLPEIKDATKQAVAIWNAISNPASKMLQLSRCATRYINPTMIIGIIIPRNAMPRNVAEINRTISQTPAASISEAMAAITVSLPRLSNSISLSITPLKMLNRASAAPNVRKANAQNSKSSIAACINVIMQLRLHIRAGNLAVVNSYAVH